MTLSFHRISFMYKLYIRATLLALHQQGLPGRQHHPKAFVLRARGRDIVQLQRGAVADLRGPPRIAGVVLQANGTAIHHQETW